MDRTEAGSRLRRNPGHHRGARAALVGAWHAGDVARARALTAGLAPLSQALFATLA